MAATAASAAVARPVAHFDEVSYTGQNTKAAAGHYRNPVMPGFQPDPSIVKVGRDFYLVNSTFAWYPGIPVYHSVDLVNWKLVGNAIDRPDQFSFVGRKTNDAIFAPAISHYGGKFRILDTCVRCGGNFMLVADRPEGPWSNPIWLKFEGIDPSLFVDDDGRAWVVNNGEPDGPARYEGHRAIWIQQIDLGTGSMFGPRKVLVDGGVHPEQRPIWAEGPHIFKRDGWYYLTAAEGGTAEDHSQTIYRSRTVTGPYEPGPVNPILTQRDLPADRPDRVEAAGHADFVKLDDGSWWAVFLGTRPFSGQSTLLGRETYLLPVKWQDGWPLILPKGAAIPLEPRRPALAAGQAADWSRWTDSFGGEKPGPEWLQLRTPIAETWYRTGDGLNLVARDDTPGDVDGKPAFLGRRLRSETASVTTRLNFQPEKGGDFAGLMAFMSENHFVAFGIAGTGADGARALEIRERRSAEEPATGIRIATYPLDAKGEIELKMDIDKGSGRFAWRPAGEQQWHDLGKPIDIEHLASIHGGLFTGTMVGPYAQAAR